MDMCREIASTVYSVIFLCEIVVKKSYTFEMKEKLFEFKRFHLNIPMNKFKLFLDFKNRHKTNRITVTKSFDIDFSCFILIVSLLGHNRCLVNTRENKFDLFDIFGSKYLNWVLTFQMIHFNFFYQHIHFF